MATINILTASREEIIRAGREVNFHTSPRWALCYKANSFTANDIMDMVKCIDAKGYDLMIVEGDKVSLHTAIEHGAWREDKILIDKSGGEVWVSYKGKFVARFQYNKPTQMAKDFVKFMKENISPAEYFTQLDEDRLAPMSILNKLGYVHPSLRNK